MYVPSCHGDKDVRRTLMLVQRAPSELHAPRVASLSAHDIQPATSQRVMPTLARSSRAFPPLQLTVTDVGGGSRSSLNPQTSTLYPLPSTLNPQPSTLNPQPLALNPQPSTLNPETET